MAAVGISRGTQPRSRNQTVACLVEGPATDEAGLIAGIHLHHARVVMTRVKGPDRPACREIGDGPGVTEPGSTHGEFVALSKCEGESHVRCCHPEWRSGSFTDLT